MKKSPKSKNIQSEFHSCYAYSFWFFAMLIAVIAISTAMGVQYFLKELPCSLCLLQRIGFFGFIFGCMLQFKAVSRFKAMGISVLFLIVLMVISVRQALLDIYPRKGHEWIGPAIFGIHLPVWTFIGCLMLLFAISLNFIFIERDTRLSIDTYPRLKKAAGILALFAVLLCAINFVSVIFQCGIYSCHTEGYYLFKFIK